jgi:magnesium transporter
MSRSLITNTKGIGQLPGSLIYIGNKSVNDVKITILEYDEAGFTEREATGIEECAPIPGKGIKWINIDGIQQTEVLREIGRQYGLHDLVLEDILNTELRPKIEFSDTYVLVSLKMLSYDSDSDEIEAEQVSMVLGHGYVLSFQEDRVGDVFDPIRNRIRTAAGKIRRAGADYLLYSLLDVIVDNYFLVLEKVGEQVEELEEEITHNPDRENLSAIYALKRELIYMRKAIWPLREIVSTLVREENSLIRKDTHKYLRDVYDHTIQVIDTTESYRDVTASLLDLYMSGVSNRTNDTMKVLTIISTIFMPLTFIAGIYGMNFDFIPELKWRYGYFAVIGVMFIICLVMLYWFRRKRWI